MVSIPFDGTEDAFSEDLELDGTSYAFSFEWNFRDTAWYMDIADSSGNPLLTGIKIVLGINLLNGAFGLPSGCLIAVPADPSQLEIAQADMGTLVSLLYASADEVQAIAQAAA